MITMKFGGTSVGTPENIQKVIQIVQNSRKKVSAVVVSAYSKVTDQLIEMTKLASHGHKIYEKYLKELELRHFESINKLIKNSKLNTQTSNKVINILNELRQVLLGVYLLRESSPKVMDLVMSFGERLSSFIITQAFIDNNIKVQRADARYLIKTDANFGHAKVNFIKTNKIIQQYFQKHNNITIIIPGFIGSTLKAETTTLGRGGSDYTASIIGAAINSKVIEIWTDVDGVLSADPNKTKGVVPIDKMTYEEAMEMSHFGAKVIFPSTMIPAMRKNIPIIIKNTFNTDFEGTIIGCQSTNGHVAKGISSISDITLILVQGSDMIGSPYLVSRLFDALAKYNINVIMITQASSEYTICLAIDPKSAEIAKHAISEEFKREIKDKTLDEPIIEHKLSIIALIGDNMRKTPGIAGRFFNVLGKNKINVIAVAQGSSERNISTVINKEDETKALNIIHSEFF